MKKVILAVILIIAVVVAVVVINKNKTEVSTNGGLQTIEENTTSEKVSSGKIDNYLFTINGKTIAINDEMNSEKFGVENNVYEVPSCAFEGNDKIYEYENFEVETYEDGEIERIYSIYFTDTKQTTTEGVCISDSYEKMVEVYGENFENDGTQCTYTKDNTCLEFIVENEVITSIKYVLKAE